MKKAAVEEGGGEAFFGEYRGRDNIVTRRFRHVNRIPYVGRMRVVEETTGQLRARYQRLDAEYRALGERMKQLLSAPGPQAKREADEAYRKLRALQEDVDRVQQQLLDRLSQEGN